MSPTRNPGIDLLRGLSIVFVILNHIGLRIPLQKTALGDIFPLRLFWTLDFNGLEAVYVFFVISGFLITNNALRRSPSLGQIDLRRFYIRRAARILPCLAVLLLLLSAFDLLRVPDYVITQPNQSLIGALSAVLDCQLNWYEGRLGYLPGGWDVLWSLSIEELFYLGFPLVCRVARWHWLLLVVPLALLALSLPVTLIMTASNEIWQEKAYLSGMAAIATGVLAALAAAHWPRLEARMVAGLGVTGVACLCAIWLVEDLIWHVLGDATMLILTFGTAALVLAFHHGWGLRQVAHRTAWLRVCGRRSFEIYLFHMFVVFAAVGLFQATGSDLHVGFLWLLPLFIAVFFLGKLVDQCFSTPAYRALCTRFIRVAE